MSKLEKDSNTQLNSDSEKKEAAFTRVNENLEAIKKAVDSGKAINESLGNPLGFVKKRIFSLFENRKRGKIPIDEKKENAGLNEKKERVLENANSCENDVYEKNPYEKEKSKKECEINKNKGDKSAFDLFENQLRACSENPLYSISVKKLVEAELGSFKLLASPKDLLLQNFSDLVMEHLLISYENIDDEKDRKNFQKNAGLLIRSIINYLQARIAYLEDDNAGVQGLIDNACDDIASVSFFILGVLTSNKTKIEADGLALSRDGIKVGKVSVKPEFDNESIKKACDELRKVKSIGIIARIFIADKKIKQEKKIFYSFLAALFENVKKYRHVFGCENRIMSQLIERYGAILAEEEAFSKKDVLKGIKKIVERQPLLKDELPEYPRKKSFYIPLIVVTLFTIVSDLGIIYAISNSNTSYFILFTILTIIVSIIVAFVVLMFIKDMYYDDIAISEWQEKVDAFWKDLANIYYRALAKTFYDFDI